MARETTKIPDPIRAVIATALAWVIPGAGHVFLGRKLRGAIIFLVIAATFWSGVAMGGVMTVDRQFERWWFIAQMCTGVHGLIGWQRQNAIYEQILDDPDILEARRTRKSEEIQYAIDARLASWPGENNEPYRGLALVAPTDTIARAYTGVAGLLNLMCMFDALVLGLMGTRGEPKPEDPSRKRRSDEPDSVKEDG
jgi:hypothetical protein